MARATLGAQLAAGLLACSRAQIPGPNYEDHPPVPIAKCTLDGGCELDQAGLTLDASFRWTHGVECADEELSLGCKATSDCNKDGGWDEELCPDPESCSKNCAIEGVNMASYTDHFGVTPAANGVELKFVTEQAGGTNVGSRLYVMDGDEKYMMFKLKNREFAFDVDVSRLPCGLNGAVYFVEMPEDGGKAKGNSAGAKYGTGYCDAMCPHNVKFMDGKVNMLDWDASSGSGRYGYCCAEMDLWEANSKSAAYTAHPCNEKGFNTCEGADCDSACDPSGCAFNSFRNGEQKFYGPGADFTVDTTRPMTVVTQWITSDGTDDGDLVDIRRLYVQDGKMIHNAPASALGEEAGNSINDKYCAAEEKGGVFASNGGMKRIGGALERGMVLALSVWADTESHMAWLDAGDSGPCPADAGNPLDDEAFADVSVTYNNFMLGEIGATVKYRTGATPLVAPRLHSDFGWPIPEATAGGHEGGRGGAAHNGWWAAAAPAALVAVAGLAVLGARRLRAAGQAPDAVLNYGLVAEGAPATAPSASVSA